MSLPCLSAPPIALYPHPSLQYSSHFHLSVPPIPHCSLTHGGVGSEGELAPKLEMPLYPSLRLLTTLSFQIHLGSEYRAARRCEHQLQVPMRSQRIPAKYILPFRFHKFTYRNISATPTDDPHNPSYWNFLFTWSHLPAVTMASSRPPAFVCACVILVRGKTQQVSAPYLFSSLNASPSITLAQLRTSTLRGIFIILP